MNTSMNSGDSFTTEFEEISEVDWSAVLKGFSDATFYQTLAYGVARCGDKRVSQMVLRRNGVTAALAVVRLHTLPLLNYGVAYVHWGPAWRKIGQIDDVVVLEQALLALTREFVHRRGLMLRMSPPVYDCEPEASSVYQAFANAGFSPSMQRDQLILIDIRPPISELRKGLAMACRNRLNKAEKAGLRIVEGKTEDLLHTFAGIHTEMSCRKGLKNDGGFRYLAEAFSKMDESTRPLVVLAEHDGRAVSGAVLSEIGKRAICLFFATNSDGMRLCASNLVQWHCITRLKTMGIEYYDLSTINPVKNPGSYHFKAGLSGKNGVETYKIVFGCSASRISNAVARAGARLRSVLQGNQIVRYL